MLRIPFLRDFPYWDFLGLLICYQEQMSGLKQLGYLLLQLFAA